MDLYIIPQIKEIMGFYSHPKLLNQNKIMEKRKGGKRWFNSFLAVFVCICKKNRKMIRDSFVLYRRNATSLCHWLKWQFFYSFWELKSEASWDVLPSVHLLGYNKVNPRTREVVDSARDLRIAFASSLNKRLVYSCFEAEKEKINDRKELKWLKNLVKRSV